MFAFLVFALTFFLFSVSSSSFFSVLQKRRKDVKGGSTIKRGQGRKKVLLKATREKHRVLFEKQFISKTGSAI